MSTLQIILSIIGILFVIWLYALIFAENLPLIDLSQLNRWWYEYRKKSLFQKIQSLIRSIVKFIQCCSQGFIWLIKFLIEFIFELIAYILIRIIWLGIKFVFHALIRIFD